MISQSSATFINKQATGAGGYYKPDKIKNIELLKDPSLLKDNSNPGLLRGPGNASPNSLAGGRKLMGGAVNSQQSMNHVYLNLKDDLIEHFDYEAVNQ